MNFWFWFFLVGFLIAAMQDLKRREVDNWLNLFLFFSGFLYIIFETFFYSEITFLVNFSFLVFFMFGVSYLFYFSRVFAGGDCKLLFALTPLLVSFDFFNSFQNVFFFIAILLFAGAIYGTFWILGLFFKNYQKNKTLFYELIRRNYFYFIFVFIFILLSFFDFIFLLFSFLLLFLLFIFFISKVVEKTSLIKSRNSKDLREGDWLEKDLSFKGRIIKATFDGLSLKDIKFLENYKNKIRVKDGIPFAPVFVFSWIIFYFRDFFMEFLVSILGV